MEWLGRRLGQRALSVSRASQAYTRPGPEAEAEMGFWLSSQYHAVATDGGGRACFCWHIAGTDLFHRCGKGLFLLVRQNCGWRAQRDDSWCAPGEQPAP